MKWRLERPDDAHLVIAALTEKGVPIPDRLTEQPPPLNDIYLSGVMEMFDLLSSCRQVGMGVGPIPWTAIDRAAERYRYATGSQEYETFVYLIVQLDQEYLEHQAAEEKQRAQKAKQKSGNANQFRP